MSHILTPIILSDMRNLFDGLKSKFGYCTTILKNFKYISRALLLIIGKWAVGQMDEQRDELNTISFESKTYKTYQRRYICETLCPLRQQSQKKNYF